MPNLTEKVSFEVARWEGGTHGGHVVTTRKTGVVVGMNEWSLEVLSRDGRRYSVPKGGTVRVSASRRAKAHLRRL